MNTMPRKNRFLNSFLSILLILSITLTNVNVALADDGPTPEPTVAAEPTEEPVQPTVEPTEPPVVEPTEPPVTATEPPVVETAVPTETAPTEQAPVIEEQAPITELLTQAPENTDLVVLDENGEALPLSSQEALNTILETDPMWCPAGVLPGGVGCTTNFASIALLIADMANTTTYDENGIIYFTSNPGASFSLTTTSLGTANFNTLNDFNLTLQGGWNGLNGVSATFTSQTNFSTNTLTIGSSGNPWIGNITLNNFSFSGVSSGAAVTVYTTSGNITLDNVDVLNQTNNTFTSLINSTSGNITVQNGSSFDGNSSNQSQGFSATTGSGSITISNTSFSESIRNGTGNTYDGATLSAPTVTLNNVTSTGSDGDGITINSANIVTLNNVTATNNGTASGAAGLAGNDGSGVFINGNAGSRVIIIGGTYTGNQEYGVEVASPANTTIYIQSNPTCTGNASNSAPPLGVSSCYNDTTVFDNTAPTITFVSRTPANANGWNNGNVAVNWSCSDSGSGVVSAAVSQTISTEGTNQSATGTCQDLAGNVASNTQSGINIDKTAPTAIATVVPSPNANGWNNTDVTVTFTGTDAGSGIASCSAAVAISTEGANQSSSSGTCTDLAGNSSALVSATGINIDKTSPVITFTSRTPANANGWNNGDVTVNWSCTDGLSGPASATVNQTISTEGANQSATGTCQDLAGNTASNTQSGINIDKAAPTAIANVNPSPNANGWNNTDVTVTFTGNDAGSGIAFCSPAVTISTEGAGQTSPSGTCTDVAGNLSAPVSISGISIDKTSPAITFMNSTPASNVNGWNNTDVTFNWSCSDILSGPVGASISQTVSTEGTNQSATGTCQDLAGNSASDTQSGINIDKTNPILNLPSDMTVEATSPAGAIVNYSVSASDNLDATPAFSCTPASGSTFVLSTTMVNCSATDHADNTSFGNFNITVQDTTGPVIAFHADVTAEATSALGANVNYSNPTTTDDVDGTGVAICSPASGNLFALGNTTVTCNATDSNQNAAIPTTFTVHVVDTTAPIIAAHADITVEATSASGAVVSYTSSATSDVVDGAGTAFCLPASGTTFSLGNTTITCTATDSNGNSAIPTTFIVHVVDTTAPVIAAHADVTVEATSASGAVVSYTSPTTSDIVDGSGTASCSPVSGSTFALGNTTVTCNATDSNGNSAIPTTFVVHVVDTTAPVIAPHADVFVAATSAAGAVVNYTSPATSDAVDGAGTASCSPAPGSLFPIGDTTVTCTASDSHNNVATSTTFVVHVVDTAAPVIDGHLDETVEATSAAGAIATYTSPATSDAVDGPGVANCTPVSGSFFAFGDTTVTCTATDSNGNVATPTNFVVHVVDTTAPVIAAHADVTAEATSASGAAVTYTSPATSDAVDGAGVASCSPASGSTFALGNTTVTCNATDSHSNASAPTAFVIHVVDTTAPVIAAHSNVSVITNNNLGTIVSYSSSATSDAVDGTGTATCLPASGSFFSVGDTLITCNATDAHGNAAQPVTFIVHVEYQPVVSVPAPTTQNQENSLNIPVTSGLLDLDCLTVIDSFGIKVTFHNLCDYQAAVSATQADTLPAQLPESYSFVNGLNVLVLFENQVVKSLPIGTGVQLDFPIPANTQDQFAVLMWDDEDGDGNGEWLDVTQLIVDQELSKVMSVDPSDELYQIMPTKRLEAFYRVITTEKTGTFVLVKK